MTPNDNRLPGGGYQPKPDESERTGTPPSGGSNVRPPQKPPTKTSR